MKRKSYLEKAITNLIDKSDKFKQYSYDDFEYIIKELEGTFFSFPTGYDELLDKEYILIEFQNPSINDFINSFIWQKPNWLNLIITNAIYFEQVFNWILLEIRSDDKDIEKIEKLLISSFRNKILSDFQSLSNSGFGDFEYDNNYNEDSFLCWIPERYNYYLELIIKIIDIEDDLEIAHFLKKEIFRCSFEGSIDISEKIAFASVARELLKMDLITSEQAISHYISGFCNDIKELVFLEYMTRACSKTSLALIRNNKEFVREADELFLDEIKTLDKKGFMDVLDFFDDFTQIKNILPLTRTAKRLRELNKDKLFEESSETLRQARILKENTDSKINEHQDYYDITDEALSDLLRNVYD